jgi:hypothetical protein
MKIAESILEIVRAFRPADLPIDYNRRSAGMRTILKEGYFVPLGSVKKALSIYLQCLCDFVSMNDIYTFIC